MKWEEISDPIHRAASDTTEAINITPSYRNSEKEELDQWTIDRLYNLLGTSILNAKSAMAKLSPHTTYFKDSLAENAKKDVRISINDPNNSISLFDLNRKNIYGEDYCVAPDILEKQIDEYWDRYMQQLREEDWKNLVTKIEREKNEIT